MVEQFYLSTDRIACTVYHSFECVCMWSTGHVLKVCEQDTLQTT